MAPEGPEGLGPRSPAYLRLLLALLLPAALFDSYDAQLRAVLLSQLKESFHVTTAAVGAASIPIGAGQFVAFFVVLAADRAGRGPVLLWSVLGYSLCTTLTAISWDLWSFAAFQSGAQVFIGAEFGVAVTLWAEEVPPAPRSVPVVAVPRELRWRCDGRARRGARFPPQRALLAGLLPPGRDARRVGHSRNPSCPARPRAIQTTTLAKDPSLGHGHHGTGRCAPGNAVMCVPTSVLAWPTFPLSTIPPSTRSSTPVT